MDVTPAILIFTPLFLPICQSFGMSTIQFGLILVYNLELVEKKFEGSLPAFIAAFTKHQAMSEDELDEVQRMIDRIRKGGSQ